MKATIIIIIIIIIIMILIITSPSCSSLKHCRHSMKPSREERAKTRDRKNYI